MCQIRDNVDLALLVHNDRFQENAVINTIFVILDSSDDTDEYDTDQYNLSTSGQDVDDHTYSHSITTRCSDFDAGTTAPNFHDIEVVPSSDGAEENITLDCVKAMIELDGMEAVIGLDDVEWVIGLNDVEVVNGSDGVKAFIGSNNLEWVIGSDKCNCIDKCNCKLISVTVTINCN